MSDRLTRHLQICEDLHQLALEENRFLKEHQRAPDAPLLERRRSLLAQLDESLAALKPAEAHALPTDPAERSARAEAIEKSRARILQILHLHKENEQLVLRYSLGPKVSSGPPPLPPSPGHLQKIYERHR